MEPDVRGLLLGLDAEHGPAEIARAVMAGTLLSGPARAGRGGGGDRRAGSPRSSSPGRGAGDPAWQAVALETLGAPVRFHSDPDLSARGAAILAAIAAGVSPEQAVASSATHPHRRADRGRAGTGRRLLARYRRASETALAWLQPRAGRLS